MESLLIVREWYFRTLFWFFQLLVIGKNSQKHVRLSLSDTVCRVFSELDFGLLGIDSTQSSSWHGSPVLHMLFLRRWREIVKGLCPPITSTLPFFTLLGSYSVWFCSNWLCFKTLILVKARIFSASRYIREILRRVTKQYSFLNANT